MRKLQHKTQKHTKEGTRSKEGDGQGLNVRGSLPRTQTVSKMSGVRIYGSRPGSSRIPRLGGEANDPAFGTCIYWYCLLTFPTNIHCNPTHLEGPTAPAPTHIRKPVQGHRTKTKEEQKKRGGLEKRGKQVIVNSIKGKGYLDIKIDGINKLNPLVEQSVVFFIPSYK